MQLPFTEVVRASDPAAAQMSGSLASVALPTWDGRTWAGARPLRSGTARWDPAGSDRVSQEIVDLDGTADIAGIDGESVLVVAATEDSLRMSRRMVDAGRSGKAARSRFGRDPRSIKSRAHGPGAPEPGLHRWSDIWRVKKVAQPVSEGHDGGHVRQRALGVESLVKDIWAPGSC